MMSIFEHISVKKRLMAVFAIWIIVFICFSVFAIMEMTNLGNIIENINDHPVKVSNAAIEARVDIIKIQRNMRDIILSRDTEEIDSELEKLKPIEQRVIRSLDTIKSHAVLDINKELEDDARNIFLQWNEGREAVIRLVREKNYEQAAAYAKNKNSQYVEMLEEKFIHIDNNARKRLYELVGQANDIETQQKTMLITVGLFISTAFFIIFMLIIKSILRPISKLQEALNTGTNTGDLSEVNLAGSNEITDMAGCYNVLVRKLKYMFWIKDGKNKLSQELSGYNTEDDITQKAVSFLARYLGAGKGVFYIFDSEDECLCLKATFAITEKEKLCDRLLLGEGIVGQVALEKKPVLLKNISKTENTISTGIISDAALSTYTFPLIYEEELYGVMELLSFEPLSQLQIDFLDEVNDIISINLYSAIQNKKVQDLLRDSEAAREEVRKKSDELEAANIKLYRQQELLQQQAEELQQTNTELEEQHQILQQQSEELQQTNMQLEEHHQQLEEHTRLLNIQNKKLEDSKKELSKRSEELELSGKYKSEFLANMSHELRTPLNSIILLSKLLVSKAKNGFGPKEIEKIGIINRSGQELLRLINDILDLSKIEAGRIGLDVGYFHSNKIIGDIRQMFSSLAREKKIKLITEDASNSLLYGDEYKICQILRNLVSNAIKFTKQGSITVKIIEDYRETGGAAFVVTDSGIGIPHDKQEIIFDEFQQVDGSISRKFGGTGLGLSISRKLAELMGGEISVKSQLGIGSEFTLFVPDIVVKADKGSEPVKTQVIGTSAKHKDVLGDDMNSKSDTNKIILVIEDDISFAEYIECIIEGMGFKTAIARNGRNGLNLAKSLRPDGILLDLVLPDINGIDVLRELKSIAELRNIPVHIISVSDKNNKAQKMGALGYGQKPMEENEVIKLVSDMIAFSEKHPKHILLIEDNLVQQELIKELIDTDDTAICTVDTEEAAKVEIEKGIYNVIILDLGLREGNGMNVCRFIGEKKLEVPIIVYTGRDLSIDEEKEIRRYADSIIIKTANSEERLLDEVTLFLHNLRKGKKYQDYMISRTQEECALSLEAKNILIVDDDSRNLFVLAAALEEYGAHIIEADNGKVALEKLKEEDVDLILMDIMMPEMDGYETIKLIRRDEGLKHIPVIAVTAKSLKEDREKCISAGADDYISKPIDYDTLIRLVKAWTSR